MEYKLCEKTYGQEEIDAIRNKYVPKFNAHVQELKDKYNLDFPGTMDLDTPQTKLNELHLYVTHGAFTKSNWTLPNAKLEDIKIPIDIVDVFRPSKEAVKIAEDTVKIGAKNLWLQYGI